MTRYSVRVTGYDRFGWSDYHSATADSPKAAARKVVRTLGALGMVNYFRTIERGQTYEVMGTSGIVATLRVSPFVIQ
jgi:hypothetical protein